MLSYYFFRLFGCLISLLPERAQLAFGRFCGTCAYYLHRPFRKKALSNLAIAYGDSKSERERKKIAIASFQSLMLTLFDYFRLSNDIVSLEENPEVVQLLEKEGQGVIFLTGHQANWEIPFIGITARYPGIAIGRPIKNTRLYNWVLSLREMNGGKIVMTKNAIRQGMRALKEGKFLGIVGDQAYPSSPYSYPLFGTRAWTASTPALLAYKTNSPLVVSTTKRKGYRYTVGASAPIWPDLSRPMKEEVPRMMDQAMGYLEKSIQETPEQWMWVHDRWKQQGIDHVKRSYRYGFILVVLPPQPDPKIPALLEKIYPRSFLTFYVPKGFQLSTENAVLYYETTRDLFVRDFRFQLVLDFYDSAPLRRYFRGLSAMKAVALPQDKDKILETLVKPEYNSQGQLFSLIHF